MDPQDPAVVYFSTLGGAQNGNPTYRSSDGGHSWTPVGPIAPAGALGIATPITTLVVDPESSQTLYAAASFSGLGAYPAVGQIFKSADAGQSWNLLFTVPGGGGPVLVDLLDSRIVYGVMGQRIYRSNDAGTTWALASPSTTKAVTSLAQASSVPPTLLAATSGDGVFRSRDSGVTWEPAREGLVGEAGFVTAVAASGPEVVYAATFAGVFRTDDGGSHWRPRTSERHAFLTPVSKPETLYAFEGAESAQGFDGIGKSEDGGASWRHVNRGLRALTLVTVLVDPTSASTIYAGGFRTVFKSLDAGVSWEAHPLGPEGFLLYVTDLERSPESPQTVYAATTGGAYTSHDGGSTWLPINEGLPSTDRVLMSIVADPQISGRLLAGTASGKLFETLDGGTGWSEVGPSSSDAGNGIVALGPEVLYFGSSDGLFRSLDSGSTWQDTAILGQVFAVEVDSTAPNRIYASSGDGLFLSVDAGAHWGPIWPRPAVSIAIRPGHPLEIRIATGEGVFRSLDGGITWSPENSGLTFGPLIAGGVGSLEWDGAGAFLYAAGIGVQKLQPRHVAMVRDR